MTMFEEIMANMDKPKETPPAGQEKPKEAPPAAGDPPPVSTVRPEELGYYSDEFEAAFPKK